MVRVLLITYLDPGHSTFMFSKWLKAGEAPFLHGVASLSPLVPSAETPSTRQNLHATWDQQIDSQKPRATRNLRVHLVQPAPMQRGKLRPGPRKEGCLHLFGLLEQNIIDWGLKQ